MQGGDKNKQEGGAANFASLSVHAIPAPHSTGTSRPPITMRSDGLMGVATAKAMPTPIAAMPERTIASKLFASPLDQFVDRLSGSSAKPRSRRWLSVAHLDARCRNKIGQRRQRREPSRDSSLSPHAFR